MLVNELISSISAYLLRNQCLPQTFSAKYGESVQFDLEWTQSLPRSKFRLSCQGPDLHWAFEGGAGGVAKEEEFFWINPCAESLEALVVRTGSAQPAKLKRIYGTLSAKSSVVWGHIKASGFDWETRQLVKEFGSLVFAHKRLPRQHGFLCQWKRRGNDAIVTVLDQGGILDDNPNVEGHALPPRVMAHYYADTYAAYLFLRHGLEQESRDYYASGLNALRFAFKSMRSYPRGPVWMHNEFKNAGLLECALILESRGELPMWLRDACQRLKCDFYQPVNVYALRYYWKTLQTRLTGADDRGRRKQCIQVLKANQSQDGLILDNNPPMYRHARDLTYHQYSLACLAGAIEAVPGNAEIEEIFLKGCEFTRRTMHANGEMSYNGRGANNIYHMASALYAFGLARQRFGFEPGDVCPVLSRLSEFKLEDGSLPTALNRYADERMGWNHCRTPYNALTAFLLKKTCDTGLFDATSRESVSEPNAYSLASGYATFRRSSYEATFFSGLAESYVYSASSRTGVSGLAMLLPRGRSPMTLILNRSLRDQGLLATDLPVFCVGANTYEPIGGSVDAIDHGLVWVFEADEFVFKRTYQFFDDQITISNELTMKQSVALSVTNAMALPLNTEVYECFFSDENPRLQLGERGGPLVASLRLEPQDTLELMSPWKETAIISNPRGRGLLLGRDIEIQSAAIRPNIRWAYTIELQQDFEP